LSGKGRWAALLSGALLVLGMVAVARAEVVQQNGVRVSLDGEIAPTRLPRTGSAPVKVKVETRIAATKGRSPAQLTRIAIAINRYGRLENIGLPVCRVSDIQPSTTERALEACRGARIGEGHFSATVGLSKKVAFPTDGKLVAFNGTYKGKPAILAHVYGTDPLPTSFTLPFLISRGGGTFGTTLTATLPAADGNYVTGLDLTLGRRYSYRGRSRSYASASCPAPNGSAAATFAFAKASYSFAGGRRLTSTLIRNCRVER
jgi:hypothetical protein